MSEGNLAKLKVPQLVAYSTTTNSLSVDVAVPKDD